MARREVSQSIPQKAGAGGNVLLTIETRPGESWLGSVMVPLANDAAQWQVTVGGVQWGSFAGVNPSTPIQAIGEQVIIQGFGITPGLMLSAIFIGEAYPAHASPNIAPASPNLSPGDQVSLAAGASVGLAPGSQLSTQSGTTLQPTGDQLLSGDLGTGADGAVTISAGTVTLARDMNYSSLTINAGATLKTAGYVIRCTGTVTNNGTIDNSGVGSTGAPSGTLSGGANGVSAAVAGISPPAADVQGGAGGSSATTAGGTVVSSPASSLSASGLRSLRFAGGASGGSASTSDTSGGGGGVILILCATLVGNGTITCNGGNASGSVTAGAGGGGGGIAYVACRSSTYTGSIRAIGGNGAPIGGNGSPGSPGRVGILTTQG